MIKAFRLFLIIFLTNYSLAFSYLHLDFIPQVNTVHDIRQLGENTILVVLRSSPETLENYFIDTSHGSIEDLIEELDEWQGACVNLWISQENKEQNIFAVENKVRNTTIFCQKDLEKISTQWPSKIEGIELYGERCSGTTFFTTLVQNNISDAKEKFRWKYSFHSKHGPIWFSAQPNHPALSDENTLFLGIFRNAYDWSGSCYRHHHNFHESVFRLPYIQFLGHEMISFKGGKELMWDRNPTTGNRFENMFQLRTAKIKSMLHMQKAPHSYFVNYEQLYDFPSAFVAEIADRFKLPINPIYKPITKRFESPNQKFTPLIYPKLKKNIIHYINSQLDASLETSLGYPLLPKKAYFQRKSAKDKYSYLKPRGQ